MHTCSHYPNTTVQSDSTIYTSTILALNTLGLQHGQCPILSHPVHFVFSCILNFASISLSENAYIFGYTSTSDMNHLWYLVPHKYTTLSICHCANQYSTIVLTSEYPSHNTNSHTLTDNQFLVSSQQIPIKNALLFSSSKHFQSYFPSPCCIHFCSLEYL